MAPFYEPQQTLDRLFDEIRREAKRNPDFADRLDAGSASTKPPRRGDEVMEGWRALTQSPPAAGEVRAKRAEGESLPAGAPHRPLSRLRRQLPRKRESKKPLRSILPVSTRRTVRRVFAPPSHRKT